MSIAIRLRQPIAEVIPDLAESPDLELVNRAKCDPREFAALYSRYLDPIYQHCYRRLASREAAEDATSLVFTKALAAMPRFNPRGDSVKGWLFTIANHVLTDHYRASRPQTSLEAAAGISNLDPSPEELVEAAESGRALRDAMTRLPERQRQVVELRLAGLTTSEIARVLDCRENSVNVAQYRALNNLRAHMGIAVQSKGGRDA
jgi:RNA polymerase sigma-70 factor (ECF subfamily)